MERFLDLNYGPILHSSMSEAAIRMFMVNNNNYLENNLIMPPIHSYLQQLQLWR